jgi:hypothetical protein
LISKNFSVASPHFWQQGDPMRPYPTELHFRISTFGNTDGIKDPKELSIVSFSNNMPSTSIYTGFSTNSANNLDDPMSATNNEISSTSFLPSGSAIDGMSFHFFSTIHNWLQGRVKCYNT